MVSFLVAPWTTPEQLNAAHLNTRALISERFDKMEAIMATIQEQLDTLTDSVNTGVEELKAEIARLAALPAGEVVDFSRLQGLADALSSDNIPAAPVEEEPAPPVDAEV